MSQNTADQGQRFAGKIGEVVERAQNQDHMITSSGISPLDAKRIVGAMPLGFGIGQLVFGGIKVTPDKKLPEGEMVVAYEQRITE